jgi:hypothetical protein
MSKVAAIPVETDEYLPVGIHEVFIDEPLYDLTFPQTACRKLAYRGKCIDHEFRVAFHGGASLREPAQCRQGIRTGFYPLHVPRVYGIVDYRGGLLHHIDASRRSK